MSGHTPPTPVVHGGAPRGVLDLSTGTNPLGTPDHVVDAVRTAGFGSYPDLDATDAERSLASDAGLRADDIVLTAGATEAIRVVLTHHLRPRDDVVIVGPTYGEYARIASSLAAAPIEVRADGPDFAVPLDAVLDAVRALRPRALIVCDPNNPTGVSFPADAWDAVLHASSGTQVIVDESFALFRPTGTTAPLDHPRLTVVRSLTKLHAIPGVRVGYIAAHRELAHAYRAWRDPWSAGAHAIKAATSGGWRFGAVERDEVARLGEHLARLVDAIGYRAAPSNAPFRLVQVGSAAQRIRDRLLDDAIAVRWCASMGLPDAIRIRVPTDDERGVLAPPLAALAAGSTD